ncbi:hypothetical protein AMK16_09690 [Streptomyces sp. CB00455]|uniref:helix-turn-helix domain-containing protein n=1 Tax=Streptomyces sp. CB00455 TaxID=1703927 RepID=UPI00093A6AC6|nr:MerR family transcriptional regulator [Streptomyces sp. CB00455]OKK20701.1 hypothetical protein AMK16_09690 [Streptomyces sp. CB00455]
MNQEKRVGIGEAAALTGLTPHTIRDYHRTGLLPEPERGPGGRCSYGYEDIVRMLWVRRMAELGRAPAEVRAALERKLAREDLLAELDASLAEQESQVRARREGVRRLREAGGDLRLLGAATVGPGPGPRAPLPGPGAGHHVLAMHPRLRVEQDRLDAELRALAGVAPEDPRVERLARQYFAHAEAVESVERAVGFPEPDFDESACGESPGEPPALSRPPDETTPSQARCAQLLGDLLARSHHPDPPAS